MHKRHEDRRVTRKVYHMAKSHAMGNFVLYRFRSDWVLMSHYLSTIHVSLACYFYTRSGFKTDSILTIHKLFVLSLSSPKHNLER